jgi:hypothetical protein
LALPQLLTPWPREWKGQRAEVLRDSAANRATPTAVGTYANGRLIAALGGERRFHATRASAARFQKRTPNRPVSPP